MEYYLAITRNEQLKQHTETLDESQNLFAEWMKPEKKKKVYALWFHFLKSRKHKLIYHEWKQISGCLGMNGKRDGLKGDMKKTFREI